MHSKKQFTYAIMFLYTFREQSNEDGSLENMEMESVITGEKDENDTTRLLEKNKQKSVKKTPKNVRSEMRFGLSITTFFINEVIT